jgi:hypothetical protein
MCKEPSSRVLITDDPMGSLQQPKGTEIEDTEKRLVFARQEIWSYVRKKIGFFCRLCTDTKSKAPSKQFPSVTVLRDHYVKSHQHDFCELCLESKPVLLFEQNLMVYSKL